MKIIFSPSKEMNFDTDKRVKISLDKKISKETKFLYEKLIHLSNEEISRLFKVNNKMTEKIINDLKAFEKGKTKASVDAYTGISFRQLRLNEYSDKDIEYMYNHLIILSAFYGFSKATEGIKNHRLDFSVKLIDEMSMYKYWEKYVNKVFEKNEIIINLASGEYSKLIDRNRVKMIDLEFYENREFKQISVNSKKARGEALNFLIMNKVENLWELKKEIVRGYSYIDELSNENKMVYIKK